MKLRSIVTMPHQRTTWKNMYVWFMLNVCSR